MQGQCEGKTEGLEEGGQKKIDAAEQSKPRKQIPMMTESKEPVIIFSCPTHTFTGISKKNFTTGPIEMNNVDT